MLLEELGLNRYGFKEEQKKTVDALDASSNAGYKAQQSISESGSQFEEPSHNILTGTVIMSCFIQTSALPARVELSGNDMKMFDDSKGGGGSITGDTSTISFIRADGNPGTFILQKRHGKDFDLDNVMEMFYTVGSASRFNYLYLCRRGDDSEYNTNYIELTVNSESTKPTAAANGEVVLRLLRNKVLYATSGITLVEANNLPGTPGTGARVFAQGEGDGGGVQLAYYRNSGDASPASYIVLDKDGLQIFPAISSVTSGRVTSAGAAVYALPTAWSVSRIALGQYTVITNGATSDHAVNITPDTANRVPRITVSAGSFTVLFQTTAGVDADSGFSFIFS